MSESEPLPQDDPVMVLIAKRNTIIGLEKAKKELGQISTGLYAAVEKLEAEVEQLRYERAQAGKRAMSAETEVERLREAATTYKNAVQKMVNGGSAIPVAEATKLLEEALEGE